MKLNTILFTTALAITAISPAFAQSNGNMNKDMKMEHSMMMGKDSGTFKGIEVNKGHVTLTQQGGKTTLSLSSDFSIPKTPAPHWQIVDGKGNVYLLKQLRIKDDQTNLSIQLPSYIKSVSKVQIWCSFAEVNLGEATFSKTINIK